MAPKDPFISLGLSLGFFVVVYCIILFGYIYIYFFLVLLSLRSLLVIENCKFVGFLQWRELAAGFHAATS